MRLIWCKDGVIFDFHNVRKIILYEMEDKVEVLDHKKITVQEFGQMEVAIEKEEKEREEKLKLIIDKYGFDPNIIGGRPRSWEEHDDYLCCCARDAGSNNCFDKEAFKKENFETIKIDEGDPTYCYYVFTPLKKEV